MDSRTKRADFGVPRKWITKDELIAIRPYAAFTTTIFNGKQSNYRSPVPLTEKEAINYCKMKGISYERMKGKSKEEDRIINRNLEGFRKAIRRSIQEVLEARKENGESTGDKTAGEHLALYDSTDEEDFVEIDLKEGRDKETEGEPDGWVFV